ncbi:unnamed protein product [Fusarium graminearum]|nr:unnamed protein product [Fusarium graminearum]
MDFFKKIGEHVENALKGDDDDDDKKPQQQHSQSQSHGGQSQQSYGQSSYGEHSQQSYGQSDYGGQSQHSYGQSSYGGQGQYGGGQSYGQSQDHGYSQSQSQYGQSHGGYGNQSQSQGGYNRPESSGRPQGQDQPHKDSSHDAAAQYLQRQQAINRYRSFAGESSGNAKWYVDGASYFWAVSQAIEQAQESIYILDWWLSPELYLRRPPAKNEQYRLDRMLKAAAERGVKVYILVYKEVAAALSCDSAHTRTALEALHENIRVFRHPDHYPTGYDFQSELGKTVKALTSFDLFKASGDALKAVYGTAGDVVLYWAHHEKLLVIDNGKIGFMGGLDMCFGRWDTNSHPIADTHPGNLDEIIFPGQDYNNARVYDFANVKDWDQNQLDRTKSSRMGWSDVTVSMTGPITRDMVDHFVDRWNFIFKEKYNKKNPGKYHALELPPRGPSGGGDRRSRGEDDHLGGLTEQFSRGMNRLRSFGEHDAPRHSDREHGSRGGNMPHIQMIRRQVISPFWSSGHPLERSIQTAYIQSINEAKHFIYIENQFFITATDDKQRVVKNKIGAALVDRIIRADHEGQPFHVWVLMPAVPAFAGDLHDDGALGTRAIMEFQYDSISRGGYSIIEKLLKAGIRDPSRYIGFYNLRNFDRINTSRTMAETEARTGVSYEDARKQKDRELGGYPEHSSEREAHEEYQGSRGDFSSPRQGGGYQSREYGGRSDRDEYHRESRRGYGDSSRGQDDDYRERHSDSRHGRRGSDSDDDRRRDRSRGGHSDYRKSNRRGSDSDDDRRRDNYGQTQRDPYGHPRADPRFARQGGYSQHDSESRYNRHDDDSDDERRGGNYGREYQPNPYDHPGADPRFARPQGSYSQQGYGGRDEYQGGYSEQSHGGRSDYDRPPRQEYSSSSRYDDRPEHSRYDGRPQSQEYQGGYSGSSSHDNRPQQQSYQQYQQGASQVADRTLDTISACYMDQGPRVTDLRWEGNPEDEINAFVSEELYIHSKLLIVDDRLVIVGSANLNDRSQLGDHDSEIAVVIEDPTPCESYMNGRPYTASRFAASLRRYLFRKHLGLIPNQRWDQPDRNWTPVDRDPNDYDWGSPADLLVRDPLHPDFHRLWTNTARVNTETFDRAFHPVPTNKVRTWKDYESFFTQYFIIPGKKDQDVKEELKKGKVEYGHIVQSEFPGGVQEVKQWLSRIRGTLVDMPLDFLVDAGDIAKEGLALNSLTDVLYT